MKGFFDTSVLVPVFYGDHVHHQASLALFIQFDRSTGCCGAHSLAEVFSTLTRMPGKHRISSAQAMLFIGSICEQLSLVCRWMETNMPERWELRLPLASWAEGFTTRCSPTAL